MKEMDNGETLLEELPKLILIEDLGMLYTTNKSKHKTRFGIYECGFCGTHFKVRTASVKNGSTKSCGCYNRSQSSKAHTVHGGTGTKLFSIWCGIKDRTSNINATNYQYYGGRGIIMCAEWFNGFNIFQQWALENGYIEGRGLSIDRVDVNGNYEPSNCRWTTQIIQCRNQRISKNNMSGFKGVCFHKASNKYVAQISINYKRIHIGSFKTAVEGGIAYNNYIIENNLEGFILNVIPTTND